MRRPIRHKDEELGVDMTPMLDIVFIMLIFFIVTTSFVKESGVDVNRPSAQSAETKKAGNIMVGITDTGEIWIDNRKVDIRSVRANIERLLVENADSAVVIQGDKLTQLGLAVRVMDQIKLAGISNISIAAEVTP